MKISKGKKERLTLIQERVNIFARFFLQAGVENIAGNARRGLARNSRFRTTFFVGLQSWAAPVVLGSDLRS